MQMFQLVCCSTSFFSRSLLLYLCVSCLVMSDSLQPHVACQAPLSMVFSKQEYQSRLSFPFPRDLPNPGFKSRYPTLYVDSLLYETPGKPISKMYRPQIYILKPFFKNCQIALKIVYNSLHAFQSTKDPASLHLYQHWIVFFTFPCLCFVFSYQFTFILLLRNSDILIIF